MREMLLLGLVLMAIAVLPVLAETKGDVKLPAKDKVKIFLLVGQSNMAGRGKVEDQDREAPARVITLTKGDAWAPAVDPIHFDKPRAGVGLGRTFGLVVAAKYEDETIALVPCAVGGTSIDQWERSGAQHKEAVRRAKIAMKDGELAGILWHQGETRSDPATYTEKVSKVLEGFREELGAKDVPIVVGELGHFYKGAEALNPVLQKLPETLAKSACVSTKGLTDQGDKTHFDAASYREMGKRYAAAWLMLVDRK